MLKDGQAEQLSAAGLDYYNHNLDTAPDFYGTIIHTRDQQDRLDTLGRVRLSAGRSEMSEAIQALCFLAGANSIFYGEKLLTTGNPDVARDRALLARLGIQSETQAQTDARGCC
jgi:biotin synthase-like enzyme